MMGFAVLLVHESPMTHDARTSDEPAGHADSDVFWKDGGAALHRHPERIGPYRISAVLGAGGMGVVYLAQQDSPQRTVALKVMKQESDHAELRRRFRVEAEALLRLKHPGIAQVFDVGMYDSPTGPEPYLAMEYVDGLRLTDYARRNRLSSRERLALIVQICHSVDHAHQHGIVHRDLKPANILVDRNGCCRVLDFGLARLTQVDVRITTLRTDVARLLGTIPYMSPEQISGNVRDIDHRSDTYALGVILYELLVDQLPYEVAHCSIPQAARVIQDVDPTPLSSVSKALKGDLETIVNKSLEKEPYRRYQSASAMAGDIQRFLDDRPIAARPVTSVYRLRKFARRNRGLVAGLCAAFVILVVGVIVSTTLAIGQYRAFRESEHQRSIAQAVNDFLNKDLLASADPTKQPDRSISLRAVLDRASGSIEGRFADAPLVEAAIRTTLSDTYKALGEYSDALKHAARALELYRAGGTRNDRMTVQAMNKAASIEGLLGHVAGAEKLFRDALHISSREFGEEDSTTLSLMNNLALVLERDAQLSEASEVLERVVAIRTRTLGEEHEHTMISINNLALVYAALARYSDAEPLYLKELDYSRRTHGNEHPGTLISINNLAVLYVNTDQAERAVPLVREVLETRTRVLGPDHPQTIESMDTLGAVWGKLRRFEEATALLEDARDRCEKTLGAEHPLTLRLLERQSRVHLAAKNLEQAEITARTCYETRRRTLGEDHAGTARTLALLATICFEQEKIEEAETLGLRSFTTLESNFGANHGVVTDLADLMHRVYARLGRPDESALWKSRAKAKP
jgi:tRNA A-37 threonylcarbamoyl transferase component Bud32/tetratricopeptide (TPR) repeat protein